jgi:hypothetical protein
MPGSGPLSRRRFLERGAGTAAATLVARHVLGGPRFVAPSDRINVAYVGAGTQGLRQLMPALQRPDLRIVAVCDPNRRSEDYVEWFRHELRDKIRAFLSDSGWAAGARACPCGREVGRELVDRHYGSASGAGCRAYADFREMPAAEKDIDAVYVFPTGPTTPPTRTRSSAAGTTSAPEPSATWAITASSRSSRC